MAKGKLSTVNLENHEIAFRNFAGAEKQYNAEGKRNFVVFLNPETAEQMARDGWNIKQLKQRDEDERPQDYLQVSVAFENRPPRIVVIAKDKKTTLTEDMVEMLDWADIDTCDVIINPYEWGPIQGKSGVKAYLKSLYVNIRIDAFEEKYENLQEVTIGGLAAVESGEEPEAITGSFADGHDVYVVGQDD